jgi:protein TonB
LVWYLHQYKGYPRETQSQGIVLLGFTVDRGGHVLNREIVTVDHGASPEILRNSGHREFENEAISMIDRAQPLPPFPDSMTEAKLDLIVPIYGPEKPTPPDPRVQSEVENPILRRTVHCSWYYPRLEGRSCPPVSRSIAGH